MKIGIWVRCGAQSTLNPRDNWGFPSRHLVSHILPAPPTMAQSTAESLCPLEAKDPCDLRPGLPYWHSEGRTHDGAALTP